MSKTVKFDLSSARLLGIASDMVEEHNYIGALKMLNKNSDLNYNDEDSYMLYAEIFDDIGLYEKCVNNWFKYIDNLLTGDINDAYEGLAVAYMNLGNDRVSAFYYNKLLSGADDIDADMRREIADSFIADEPNPLKFVYPPEIADYSDAISEGIGKMRLGEYEEACKSFDTVAEGNDAYVSARNYIAMCDIIADKCDEAEAECLNILKKHPDSVQALTTLAAVKTEQKKTEESKALAEKLLALDVKSTDDIYKIATVCCENKMHAEAYNLFCKLEGELSYDSSLLFFKAVSAYNCGKTEESFSSFDKLLTIYPDSVTAQYIYETAKQAYDKGDKSELSYFCRLPKEQREQTLKMLAAFSKLKGEESKKLFNELDISGCVLWCFDEMEGGLRDEVQYLAVDCAVKARLDGIIADLLLNAFLPETLKVYILTLLGERNEQNSFGVVVCSIYKRIDFRSLKVGKAKRRKFVNAYARLTSHFAIIEPDFAEKFALTAESVYNKLEAGENLSLAENEDALSAVVYLLSEVHGAGLELTRENLCSFFEADEKAVEKLLEVL